MPGVIVRTTLLTHISLTEVGVALVGNRRESIILVTCLVQ